MTVSTIVQIYRWTWEWKCFQCYWILKQIEAFHIQPLILSH